MEVTVGLYKITITIFNTFCNRDVESTVTYPLDIEICYYMNFNF